jgi:hypothetical protein
MWIAATIVMFVITTSIITFMVKNTICNFNRYIFTPLYPDTIKKHLDEDWTIDTHNSLLRITDKDKDVRSIKDVLGVIRVNSMIGRDLSVTIPDGRDCIFEIYTFSNDKVGHLINSIPISGGAIISTGYKGNIKLPKGDYLPLLRLKGNVYNDWISSIKIKFRTSKAPELPAQPLPFNDEIILEDVNNATNIPLVPSGNHVRRYVWSGVVEGPCTLTARWKNRGQSTTVIANVLGNRFEKFESDIDEYKEQIWVIPQVTRNVTIIETIFGVDHMSILSPLNVSCT